MSEIREFLPVDLYAGKTVFVTGGGSGINLGVAKSFAALGAAVGICGRTAERLDAAGAELEALGARVSTSVADVRDYDALAAAFADCRERLGPIHTLVCAAAGNFLAPAETLSANGFRTVVEIDLNGSFNAARAAFEQLRETRGNLIFISAGQAFEPYFAQAHCGAAKAGVDNLMQNLALEWGRFGIRSNSIAPGPIEGTEGMKRLGPQDGEGQAALRRAVPLGRYGTAEEIGAAAVFLASPLASYITGTRLVVDGGMNLPGSGLFTQLVMKAMEAGPERHP
jgi:NAD(P)-dependent dehydrogenase (short-subunit alcohol dehydrogenase family)